MTKINKKINKPNRSWIPTVLIIAGILVIASVILILKNSSDSTRIQADELPETKFDRSLEGKRPIFVFFHSTNCQLCIEMIQNVDKIYPEFKDSVVLVDVNVYDESNKQILLRFNIHSIPTLAFIDRNGDGKLSIGVMSPNQLRDQLLLLAGE